MSGWLKGVLIRIVIAAVCVVIFGLVFPLFLSVIGFPVKENLLALIHLVIICGAVLYALFGPSPTWPAA